MVDSTTTEATTPEEIWPEFVWLVYLALPVTVIRNKSDLTGEPAESPRKVTIR